MLGDVFELASLAWQAVKSYIDFQYELYSIEIRDGTIPAHSIPIPIPLTVVRFRFRFHEGPIPIPESRFHLEKLNRINS